MSHQNTSKSGPAEASDQLTYWEQAKAADEAFRARLHAKHEDRFALDTTSKPGTAHPRRMEAYSVPFTASSAALAVDGGEGEG